MSAFLVSDRHLNVLLTSGLQTDPLYGPLRWQAPDHHDPRTVTLTQIVERGAPWGVDAPARADLLDRKLTTATVNTVGCILLAANMDSVNHRYDEASIEPLYQFQPAESLTPVQVLKALDSFEYQSCEPFEWAWSEAHAICEALRSDSTRRLDGYAEADWIL